MAHAPQLQAGVEDKVVDLASIAIPETNLGRWKRARVAPRWLVESIREVGLLHAPVVRPATFPLDPPQPYVLVVCEKLLLAVRELGATVIRVSVRTFPSPEKAHAAAILENMDRVELTLHDEMQVVARYSKATRRTALDVAHDLHLPPKRVQWYLKAHAQMAPDIMKAFAACQNRTHAMIYLSTAVRTKDHDEQRALLAGTNITNNKKRRRRTVSRILEQIETLNTAEALTIRPGFKALDVLGADEPLSQRERALMALALEWTLPHHNVRNGGGPANLFPVLSTSEEKIQKQRRMRDKKLELLDSKQFLPRKDTP